MEDGKMTHILLIDDNRNFQMGLTKSLQKAGFRVNVASNGGEGLKLAREIQPELILCDVKMPVLDGVAVKRALADDISTAEIPFIFLSALSSSENKIKGLHVGADDYIAKPLELGELIARIETVLRRKKRADLASKSQVLHLLENLKTTLPIHTSHQFRTYLGALMLALDVIKNSSESTLALSLARYSTHQIRKMIGDLIWVNEFDLDRNEIFTQQLNLEVDFISPIKELIELYHEEKRIKINILVEEGLVVVAPAHSFTQAVTNLVDNACKFSPYGGLVNVELKKNRLGGCALTVIDQGPGIPMAMSEIVFERFYQIQNEHELPQNHGLGLGLYLARTFARSRGGDVRILGCRSCCTVQMTLNPITYDSFTLKYPSNRS